MSDTGRSSLQGDERRRASRSTGRRRGEAGSREPRALRGRTGATTWHLGRTLVVAALSIASAGVAGGPPVVNENDHVIDQPFTEDVGFDCGTGMPTFIAGVFTGVLHTVVQTDGSVYFTGAVRGSLSEDDLPTDGQTDATETFGLVVKGLVLSAGEVDHSSLNGRESRQLVSRSEFTKCCR
jgi:hypothetical protein